MLVYLKEPMGYSEIAGQRIYGSKYARGTFGPRDIPWDLYQKNKEILAHAEYTDDWLSKKFSKQFPSISFTVDTLKDLDDSTLAELARLLGVRYINKAYGRAMDLKERNAIIRSIILALNEQL